MFRCILLGVTIFAIIASASASPIPDDDDFGIDVNKTLKNVRDILEANPLLPRLSETEILFLLNNITAQDKLEQSEEDSSSNETTDKEEKIMVVYPFQPNKDEDGDMTELFTKPPIVKYVSSIPSRDREDLTTEVPKKKTNVPKKATSSFKTDESKDLTKSDHKKNEFPSLIEDTIVFNNEFTDQHPVESSAFPDVSAYDTFKSIPNDEQAIPEHIRSILKQIEGESSSLKQTDAEKTSSSNDDQKFEYIDTDTFPEEMTSLLTDLGLMKTNPESQRQLSSGIDPLSLEEVTVDDTIGNELKKRQQAENVTEIAKATTEENKKTEKEESTEKPTLADLESSFGASSADDDPSEAELPPPRRNGFYYMLDWNSFLEVGDGDDKVNIRFNPKLGDPQRFIAVAVP